MHSLDFYSESLASNAICLYENQGKEELIEFLNKLSFTQLISIRDYILPGKGHFDNPSQSLILEIIRSVVLGE